jgi:capsule biosynthesis phosphatase
VLPKPGAKDFIDLLHNKGHTIIIHTARNMQTRGHNVGAVIKAVGKITLDWLDTHEIHYDEIFFGKPNADITIDDRAIRFIDWSGLSEDLLEREARKE